MKKLYFLIFATLPFFVFSQNTNTVISLNGITEFEQTENAFPPEKFTRKIPVPGLIDLAEPKIDQYDLYFSGQHQPRYNWYRFQFNISKKDANKFVILKLLKSRYNT